MKLSFYLNNTLVQYDIKPDEYLAEVLRRNGVLSMHISCNETSCGACTVLVDDKPGSMMGSGGMIVMDETSCMVSVAKFYLDFTVEESCGKCSPCRIGNKRLCEILDKITKGQGTMEDLDKLRNLAHVIKDTALCGLGQTSPNPVLSTIDNFWDEYVAHVVDKKCPAGQCKALKQYVIDPEKCKGCTACARNCPVGAISGTVKMPHEINQELCIKCGTCIEKCKFNAISIK